MSYVHAASLGHESCESAAVSRRGVLCASLRCLCVATKVGGVPEVLPSDMLVLAEPTPESLLAALGRAMELLPKSDPLERHRRVSEMYDWRDIAERVERVYDKV